MNIASLDAYLRGKEEQTPQVIVNPADAERLRSEFTFVKVVSSALVAPGTAYVSIHRTPEDRCTP